MFSFEIAFGAVDKDGNSLFAKICPAWTTNTMFSSILITSTKALFYSAMNGYSLVTIIIVDLADNS